MLLATLSNRFAVGLDVKYPVQNSFAFDAYGKKSSSFFVRVGLAAVTASI
jgi:hypothetical protein